jgi:alpha-1,3-rhamnosyltransferase
MEFKDRKEHDNLLVSIIVITYNSSLYVLETLESVRVQTYQNIELIVSDDCSTDNTVEICKTWIQENKDRFVRTELIAVSQNTGIPMNCNRGVKVARGEWVKLIAGDDALESSAIASLIKFAMANPMAEVLDSKVKLCENILSNKNGEINNYDHNFFSLNISSIDQLKMLANNMNGARIISTLGVFIKRDLIIKVGGFNLKYRHLEDTPMWIRILKADKKFYFLNEYTVKYRLHNQSVSSKINYNNNQVISEFKLNVDQLIFDELFTYLNVMNKLNILWFRFIYKLILTLGNSGKFSVKILEIGQALQPIRLLWFQRKYNQIVKK